MGFRLDPKRRMIMLAKAVLLCSEISHHPIRTGAVEGGRGKENPINSSLCLGTSTRKYSRVKDLKCSVVICTRCRLVKLL
jgi:hypothetical protein